MINKFVTDIGGIALYGIISILLFVAVFTGAVGWALCQKKSVLKKLGDLPLNDGEKIPDAKGVSHE